MTEGITREVKTVSWQADLCGEWSEISGWDGQPA